MNIKNTIENTAIAVLFSVVFLFLGAFIGYSVSKKIMTEQNKLIEIIVIRAMDKNTTEIVNSFEKIKNKKGEPININFSNNQESATNLEKDTIVEINQIKKKRGFFDFFKRNK